MEIYLVFNVRNNKWLLTENLAREFEVDLSSATIFDNKIDAQEFADDFNEQDLEFGNNDDFRQYLPKSDWDFSEDGELEERQLSGPWIVKTFQLLEKRK